MSPGGDGIEPSPRTAEEKQQMPEFVAHTRDTAPESARSVLDATKEKYGFTPNLIRVLAESPAAAEAYVTLAGLFAATSLSSVEQQVVLLAVSVDNGCDYCVAAHSAGARMTGVSDDVIEALRVGQALPDAKLDTLARFTRRVVRERGWVGDDDVQSFLDVGYVRANVLEVVLGVTLKTLSNYSNHIAAAELDPAFRDFAWQKPSEAQSTAAA